MSNICSRTTLKSNDLSSLQKELNFIRRKVCEALTSGGGGSLPDQSGHSGEFLTTDGTSASWAAGGGGITGPDGFNGTASIDVVGNMNSHIFSVEGTGELYLRSTIADLVFSEGDDFVGFTDHRTTKRGVEYDSDYSANYTNLSLITRRDAWLTQGTTTIRDNSSIDLDGNSLRIGFDDGAGNVSTIDMNQGVIGTTIQAVSGSNTLYQLDVNNDNGLGFTYSEDGITIYTARFSTHGIQYGADYSANFTDRSLIDRGYLGQLGVGLIPATTNAIALGSTSKAYTAIFIASGGKVDFGNGGGVLSSTNAAEMIAAPSNGTFRIFKTGVSGIFQLINGSFTDGIQIDSSTNIIKTLAGTNIIMQNGAGEKLGVGAVTPTAKLHIAASTTTIASLHLDAAAAPTSPNDGDIWREDNTNTGLKYRVNGVTKTIVLV